MKFLGLFTLLILFAIPAHSQWVETARNNSYYKFTLEFHHDNWINLPDEIETDNIRNRGMRISWVRPFKREGPGFSFATGGAYSRHNYYLNVYEWKFDNDGQIKPESLTPDTTDHSNKLTTVWFEIPVELQYVTDKPPNDQWVFIAGLRPGLLLRGLSTYSTDDHTHTLNTRNNFNNFRLNGYLRAGWSSFSLNFGMSITPLFSDPAPAIRTWEAGLTISLW